MTTNPSRIAPWPSGAAASPGWETMRSAGGRRSERLARIRQAFLGHGARDGHAARFVQLYQLGDTRPLTMDEENELWAIACRRLHLCPLSRMFAFQHGRRPAEDPFLRSAWRYLLGARPQLAAAVGPVLTPRPARRAS